jgi:hypothetical protein
MVCIQIIMLRLIHHKNRHEKYSFYIVFYPACNIFTPCLYFLMFYLCYEVKKMYHDIKSCALEKIEGKCRITILDPRD